VLPALLVRLRQSGLHLANGLSGEEQATARVVDDLGRQRQLVARPPQEVHTPVACRTLRSQNLHALNGSDARQPLLHRRVSGITSRMAASVSEKLAILLSTSRWR